MVNCNNTFTRRLQHSTALLQQLGNVRRLHAEDHPLNLQTKNDRPAGSKQSTGQENSDKRPFVLPHQTLDLFHGKAYYNNSHLVSLARIYGDKGAQGLAQQSFAFRDALFSAQRSLLPSTGKRLTDHRGIRMGITNAVHINYNYKHNIIAAGNFGGIGLDLLAAPFT
ncbi:hypothetical protein D3C80_1137460 [compost metagenome]